MAKKFYHSQNSFLKANVEGENVWLNVPFRRAGKFLRHYLECKERAPAQTSAVINPGCNGRSGIAPYIIPRPLSGGPPSSTNWLRITYPDKMREIFARVSGGGGRKVAW